MRLKKAISASAVGLLASSAYAQSSVTMYGLLDMGLHYYNNVNGGSRWNFDSLNGMAGSRWGLTGKEGLGAGLRAIFTLEGGINLPNGQAAQGESLFGRQAFVGLQSDQYGTVTFGRQYDMIFFYPEPLTAMGLVTTGVAAHPGDINNDGNTVRLNNVAKYQSPNYGGFTYGAEWSFGGVPGDFTARSGYSLGAGYEHGGLHVAFGMDRFKNPTSATPATGYFTSNGNGISAVAYSINRGYVSAQAFQTATLAANYTVGNFRFAGSFSNTRWENMTAFDNRSVTFNGFDIGVRYNFTPIWSAAIAYDYTTSKGVLTNDGTRVGNQHYNQFSALTDYTLSKTTVIYFGIGYQRASGTSSLGTPARGDIDISGDSSNRGQIETRLGFRHSF